MPIPPANGNSVRGPVVVHAKVRQWVVEVWPSKVPVAGVACKGADGVLALPIVRCATAAGLLEYLGGIIGFAGDAITDPRLVGLHIESAYTVRAWLTRQSRRSGDRVRWGSVRFVLSGRAWPEGPVRLPPLVDWYARE